MVIALRLIIGLVFFVSGLEKLISPYQNFLFVIQSYDFLPGVLETPAAQIVPWIEFFMGIFLISGLWLKASLISTITMFVLFIGIVAQAMVRQLPIDDCGCFGEMASFPLYAIIIMDMTLLLISAFVYRQCSKALKFSLDAFLSR